MRATGRIPPPPPTPTGGRGGDVLVLCSCSYIPPTVHYSIADISKYHHHFYLRDFSSSLAALAARSRPDGSKPDQTGDLSPFPFPASALPPGGFPPPSPSDGGTGNCGGSSPIGGVGLLMPNNQDIANRSRLGNLAPEVLMKFLNTCKPNTDSHSLGFAPRRIC